ncbi:hypothetical protein TIFTF001_034151 [Ficus carica]|uniref:Uncharacterized protein n=1 Tax=Ficus carica TaxID=3494 RepID=A0AA88E0L2_FICCA|nr:hypothetical protein TIFTF001_034151 [Ficus carica]
MVPDVLGKFGCDVRVVWARIDEVDENRLKECLAVELVGSIASQIARNVDSATDSSSCVVVSRVVTLHDGKKEQTVKKKKKSKEFSNVPRMEKIMVMLSGAIPVGESSDVDSSWCHYYEPSMSPTKESIDSSEEEVDGANKRFVGLGYLKENPASNLLVEEIKSWHDRFGISEGIKLRIPNSTERADCPEWVGLL